MQLVAYGEQDIYLTGPDKYDKTGKLRGNPRMTYFKYVYRRHTNFAIEQVEHNIETSKSIAEWKGLVTLGSHSGDLVHKCYVKMEFTAGVTMDNQGVSTNYLSFTNNTGHAYLKEVSIRIGGKDIDTHDSEWFDIENELTDADLNEHSLVNKHAGKKVYYNSVKNPEVASGSQVIYIGSTDTLTCYVPLKFWFNKNAGLSLPLIALQHHKAELHMTFRKLDALFNSNTTFSNPATIPNVTMLVDYIFLDQEERRKFASDDHIYLIEQVQRIPAETLTKAHNLTFNHPIKELIWVCRNSLAATELSDPSTNGADSDGTVNLSSDSANFGASWKKNDYFNYSCPDRTLLTEVIGGSKSFEPFTYARIAFNGVNRIEKQRPSYFRIVQPSSHHSKVPGKHIYCYSFAIKPEEYQPSGTCNFSRIQKAQLLFDSVVDSAQLMTILIYAKSYNILGFHNGMAGLKYSN